MSWYIPTTSPCSVNLPWKALTDFHSQCDITVKEVVKILSDAPQLKRLVVYISDSLEYPFPLPSVVHNHLRELEITTRRHVTGIFEALTLPALEILYINDQIHSCANWPHEQFLSFLRHFCSTLTSFYLISPVVTQENIVDYLRCTNSLILLHLANGVNGDLAIDQVVSALTYRGIEEMPCLCPGLESISLGGKFEDERVIAMIESRWRLIPANHCIHEDVDTSTSIDQCRSDSDAAGTASPDKSVTRRAPSYHEPPPRRLKSVEIEMHTNSQTHIDRLVSFQDEGLQIEYL
jgi:hypothetical protein